MSERDLQLCFRCQFTTIPTDDELGLCPTCKEEMRAGAVSGDERSFVREAVAEGKMERLRQTARMERGW